MDLFTLPTTLMFRRSNHWIPAQALRLEWSMLWSKNKLNQFLLFLDSQGKNILSNALAWSHTKQVQHRRGISHSYDWQVVLMADQQEFCNPMINISEKSWRASSPWQHHWFTRKKGKCDERPCHEVWTPSRKFHTWIEALEHPPARPVTKHIFSNE